MIDTFNGFFFGSKAVRTVDEQRDAHKKEQCHAHNERLIKYQPRNPPRCHGQILDEPDPHSNTRHRELCDHLLGHLATSLARVFVFVVVGCKTVEGVD